MHEGGTSTWVLAALEHLECPLTVIVFKALLLLAVIINRIDVSVSDNIRQLKNLLLITEMLELNLNRVLPIRVRLQRTRQKVKLGLPSLSLLWDDRMLHPFIYNIK